LELLESAAIFFLELGFFADDLGFFFAYGFSVLEVAYELLVAVGVLLGDGEGVFGLVAEVLELFFSFDSPFFK
jgi:hypothetical protein